MDASYGPEEWPGLFENRLNAGDVEAVLALYEAGASIVTPAGATVVGRDEIGRVIAELIRTNTRLQARVAKVVTVDDIAVLYTDFHGTTVAASGKAAEVRYSAIEVLRRQADGTWKLIVGDPNGRAP